MAPLAAVLVSEGVGALGHINSRAAFRALCAQPVLVQRELMALAPPEGDNLVYVGALQLHPIALDITFSLGADPRFLSDLRESGVRRWAVLARRLPTLPRAPCSP